MPAQSKAQHGIMGMAYAYKKGDLPEDKIPPRVRKKVKEIASGMTAEQLKHYTSTPKRSLPKQKGRRRYINKTRVS